MLLTSKQGVASISVALNLALVILKVVVGMAIGSVSVVSESIHSGIDLLAALMALFAVRTSSRPPDKQHLFGHGKVESLAGLGEALLIFVAALVIVNEALQKLLHGVELESVDMGIVVMAISTVGNLVVARWVLKVAKATDSMALEADGWHHATDVLTSVGVAVGLVAVRFTGRSGLDPVAAIVVAAIICKAAYDITVRSMSDLMDASLPEAEQTRILEVLDKHSADMVVGYHRLRTRKSGSERQLDLHLVVKRDATVQQSHDLCDHLEGHLETALGPASINIHVEPCQANCPRCRPNCPGEEKAS